MIYFMSKIQTVQVETELDDFYNDWENKQKKIKLFSKFDSINLDKPDSDFQFTPIKKKVQIQNKPKKIRIFKGPSKKSDKSSIF